jgi:L-lysine exporter family protein LysE/ArgO
MKMMPEAKTSMELLGSGFLLSLSLCLDLGLVNVATMRVGIRRGVIPAFAVGAGSCLGDLVYATIALTGISAILQFSTVRWLLWLAGSAALAFFAFKAFNDSLHPRKEQWKCEPENGDLGLSVCFSQGFGLALASPSAILWFATIGGAVIATTGKGSHAAAALFLLGFFGAGLLWSLIIAIASGQGRRFGTKFVRTFSLVAAVVFVVLAVKVFLNGFETFVRR